MNDNQQELREIAEHEQWLAGVLPPARSHSTEHLKLRARIELGEQWLRNQWNSAQGQPAPHPLREAIRHALPQSPNQPVVQAVQGPRITLRRAWIAGLGLAAMLFLSVAILRTGETETSNPPDDFTALDEAANTEDFDYELDEAWAELEDLLASRDESEWEDVLEGL